MKQAVIGAAAGALVVGGIWFFTNATTNTVAKVGGTKITKEAFLNEMERASGQDVLRQMINDQLIKDGAQKYNITVSDKEVDDEIAKLKSQFPSDAQFEQSLAENHVTMDELKDRARINLLLNKLEVKDVKISDDEIKKYFEQNKDQLNEPEQVRASHILVDTLDEANQVEQRLKKGEDFAKIAKEVSKDPGSASKGGDLGYFPKGKMVPEFEKVAFSLKVGEVSDPVKTQFGYHIIKVTDHKPAKEAKLDDPDVRKKIEDALKQQKAKQPQQVLDELRKEENVDIVWAQYKDLFNAGNASAQGTTGADSAQASNSGQKQ
ncbi:foldase protein PrsA [Collibacillus ludicampi]|uniref:Foldase protein PrsA n=1 Tax=Collibacillus ludicampi TaxID=2771369 RepID=A0AAV4LC81_9BACL|nr:peptidylprolyl isomerase [Collibacillus ludicampi]GIM45457.1 foldase protein PrsA [Collibacillus ludicampi]